MAQTSPTDELDARYSDEGAAPTEWAQALERFVAAELYWLSTVRPDGRLHVTPLIAVWSNGAAYFCTGPQEQKARNVARSPHCVLMTGCNALGDGLDVVLEGDAVRVTDEARLQRLADLWVEKYGGDWRFEVRDGAFAHEAGGALVFEVAPARGFGFAKGDPFSQTRWRFDQG